MSGTIAEDARSRPLSTRMYCKAGPVKIRLTRDGFATALLALQANRTVALACAARAVPDQDPGPLSPRAQAATACRVPQPASERTVPDELQS